MKIIRYNPLLHFDEVSSWFNGNMPAPGFFDPRYTFLATEKDELLAFCCLIDTSACFCIGEFLKTNPKVSPYKQAKALIRAVQALRACAKILKKSFIMALVPEKNEAVLKLYRRMTEAGLGKEQDDNIRLFMGRI